MLKNCPHCIRFRLFPQPANLDWDAYFTLEAYIAAMKSKDNRTQVGACIVGPDHEVRSKGYNGPCRGEDDSNDAIYYQPLKRLWFEHAERNALYNLARIGVSGKGCVMYSTLHPCIDCARGIVQIGIAAVVLPAAYPDAAHLDDSQIAAAELLNRLGVEVRWWQGTLPPLTILSNGQSYRFHGS